ncbi:hypothetical protein FB45DRAFT_930585 [Roridomyces roridus]|uniref:Uncharacterized protein n=1 Tax=Roridomyces roridus TaxID=1738132 RepID=A0AAD7BEZ3_9AGAR|nr:hypothetical protein FB45DRAFT_930585 [Roridomyces roridus]
MWLFHTLLCVLGCAAFANAIYYIDDQDSSITYNSSAGVGYGEKWHKYSHEKSNSLAVSVDESICFGGTATYTTCYTSDHCTLTIPFNGTGITLFVPQDVGDIYNTSISLDGGPPSVHFAYTPPNATAEAYNVTLYDIQNLEWTTHSLQVELIGMRLIFDFAAVTGDQPTSSSAAVPRAAASLSSMTLALTAAAFYLS